MGIHSRSSTAIAESVPFRFSLGADHVADFAPGLHVLAGEAVESLFGATRPAGHQGSLALFQNEDWLLGAVSVSLSSGLDEAAQRIYGDIFLATQGWHLARIWNYVPGINEAGPAKLENYRIFCCGRSVAFEQHFGNEFKVWLPSASAVGSRSKALTVIFAACSAQTRHMENPLQMPAYDYPDKHGPRAPSFARATIVQGVAHPAVFISGTAAIRGHTTIAPHSIRQQLTCTLENLHEISQACGLGPNLDQGGDSTRHFKVYLRHASDQSIVAAILSEKLLTGMDHVTYLLADMCRASLLVEIEATLFGAPTAPLAGVATRD